MDMRGSAGVRIHRGTMSNDDESGVGVRRRIQGARVTSQPCRRYDEFASAVLPSPTGLCFTTKPKGLAELSPGFAEPWVMACPPLKQERNPKGVASGSRFVGQGSAQARRHCRQDGGTLSTESFLRPINTGHILAGTDGEDGEDGSLVIDRCAETATAATCTGTGLMNA